MYVTTAVSGDDWTATCPKSCVCKWTNGKKSVFCTDRQLTSTPTTLSAEVQVLGLNDNHIAYLNREEFSSLSLVNLQRIYLKNSQVAFIHRDAFKNLKILVELDLSENAIANLDKQTFNGNDRLRILYLYGNPLKQLVSHQFPVLPHLRSLDLHNCQLSSIDPTAFANLELLELLNLQTNQLEHMSETVFSYTNHLKTLLLEGNPWRCDCRLRYFRNWYTQSNLNSVGLTCRQPLAVRGKSWEDVDENLFGCQPRVDIFSEEIAFTVDIGSNITFGCLIYGDPLPTVTWEYNGRDIAAENVLFEDEAHRDSVWRNLTIFNVTQYDAGTYVCLARNNVGVASKNVSLFLTEIVQRVTERSPETFWYFGLILGTFGTVFGLMILAVVICLCKTKQRSRAVKNIKGSVSFNDQEKKLLDLSITTNDRRDSCETTTTAHTPSTTKADSVLALEPVQITIESLGGCSPGNGTRNNEEFPLSVGLFPPPPEFCSNVVSANPTYGNIFISVAIPHQHQHHQQHDNNVDSAELNMYPDLLNIPNRVIGKLFPINVASFATLPRNRHRGGMQPPTSEAGCRLQKVINYQNLETKLPENGNSSGGGGGGGGGGGVSLCAGCLKSQDQYNINNGLESSMARKPMPKYDNMGRRITASGNSTLSLPDDEEDEEKDVMYTSVQDHRAAAAAAAAATDLDNARFLHLGCDYVSL